FVCGGLPGRAGRWFTLDETGRLTRRQSRALAGLIAVCFLVQLPRGLLVYHADPEQAGVLQTIPEMEARCRAHPIGGDDARAVLPKLALRGSASNVNGWELLRGSDDPWPHTTEEIKRLLQKQ